MANKMNPEVKAKWVAALRSGQYAQGRSVLRSDDGYCCLGVLCDVAAKEGVGTWAKDDQGDWIFDGSGFATVPDSVMNWSGVEDSVGGYIEFDGMRTVLPELNDGLRCTFAQIADVIEAQL